MLSRETICRVADYSMCLDLKAAVVVEEVVVEEADCRHRRRVDRCCRESDPVRIHEAERGILAQASGKLRSGDGIVHSHFIDGADPRGHDDIREFIVRDIRESHADAGRHGAVERGDRSFECAGRSRKNLHIRRVIGTGSDDEVGPAVAREVAGFPVGADVDAAAIFAFVREEVAERTGNDCPCREVIDFDVRSTARSGTDHQIRATVLCEVGRGDGDAASEIRIEGHEVHDRLTALAIEHADVWSATSARRPQSSQAHYRR